MFMMYPVAYGLGKLLQDTQDHVAYGNLLCTLALVVGITHVMIVLLALLFSRS